MVKALGNGLYDVASSSRDLSYVVKPGVSCTCPDHQFRKRACRHMKAVEEFIAAQPSEDPLAAKAKTLNDEQLAFFAARYAGQPAGTACIAELACRLAAAKAQATRPVIGTSTKTFGPRTDAEAAAWR